MQSVVSGLMQGFKAAFASDGTDWDYMPYDMCLYGGGGCGGWATLCGIANACPAAANLVGLHGALASDFIGHYCLTEWPNATLADIYWDDDPTYGPSSTGYSSIWSVAKTPIPDDEVLAKVVPHSPICHISISKWCYEAGVNLGTGNPYGFTHKNDRCGKIAAEMAGYVAEMFNYYALNGASADPYVMPPETAECSSCHKTSSDPQYYPAQIGKMDCVECHSPGTIHMDLDMIIEDIWIEHNSTGAPDTTFSAGEWVDYKVRFALLGPGVGYVTTKPGASGAIGQNGGGGTWKYGLSKGSTEMAAVQTWQWTKQIPGTASGLGKFVMHLLLGDTPSGPFLDQAKKEIMFNVV
jgi:hypothetical protein